MRCSRRNCVELVPPLYACGTLNPHGRYLLTRQRNSTSLERCTHSSASGEFGHKNMMFKVKILVVGPCKSGKTVLSNFLADATDTSSGDYHPTQGCRILEFETNNFNSRQNIEVELWDISGDTKFESCWPAIAKDTNGVLFVYNPDQGSHGQELDKLHEFFIQNQGLKDSQCALFAHHKPGAPDRDRADLPAGFSNVSPIHTNIEEDGEAVRDNFNKFLSGLQGIMSTNRDQEELSIMNQR